MAKAKVNNQSSAVYHSPQEWGAYISTFLGKRVTIHAVFNSENKQDIVGIIRVYKDKDAFGKPFRVPYVYFDEGTNTYYIEVVEIHSIRECPEVTPDSFWEGIADAHNV